MNEFTLYQLCRIFYVQLVDKRINFLFQELEEIYVDLCATVTESILQGAEVVSSRVSYSRNFIHFFYP